MKDKKGGMLKGWNISKMFTLGSMYDNNCVGVVDGEGNEFRMPCSTIIQMVNEFTFATHKKIKHTYIANVIWEEGFDGKKSN